MYFSHITSFISVSWFFGDTWMMSSLGPVLTPLCTLFQSWFSVLLVRFPHSSVHWPQQQQERCSIFVQLHCRRAGIIFDLQKWLVFIQPSSEDSGWPQRSVSPQRHWWARLRISEANCTTEVIWSCFFELKEREREGGERRQKGKNKNGWRKKEIDWVSG